MKYKTMLVCGAVITGLWVLLDLLLVLTATVYGAYVGGLALVHAYAWLRRHASRPLATTALGLTLLLSAVGVYIGRYGRWNSWEGLTHPWSILTDLLHSLSTPTLRSRFLLVILTIVLFQTLTFWCVRYSQKSRQP